MVVIKKPYIYNKFETILNYKTKTEKMNILNETPTQITERRQIIFRLNQELSKACKEVKKDNLYKMYLGEARTIMTYDYFINWLPLEDLKIVLKQVREENNNEKF